MQSATEKLQHLNSSEFSAGRKRRERVGMNVGGGKIKHVTDNEENFGAFQSVFAPL